MGETQFSEGRIMADKSTRYDRHCELWKEHDKQVGHWVFGTIIFAIILQHKVLIPYTGIPKQKNLLEANLQEVRGSLQAIQVERKALRDSEERLARIKATIEQAPWASERDRLRRSFVELQRCSEMIVQVPRANLIATMDESAEFIREHRRSPLLLAQLPPMDRNAGIGANSPLNVRQFPEVLNANPPPNASRDAPLNVLQSPPAVNLPFANMPFEQALPNAPGIPNTGQDFGMASVSPDVRAILVLGLDRDALMAVESDEQFGALVDNQKRKQGQQMADETVTRVAEIVDQLVIKPLEELPGHMPEVAKLRTDVEKWERDHIGEPQWYLTVPGKGETIGFVGNQAAAQTAALVQVFDRKEKWLESQIATLGDKESTSKQDIEKLDGQREKLETRMQKLLPEWLQELVTADEMLQLYPLTLMGLLAAIGLQAFLVRSHYLVVRSGYESQDLPVQDPAVASLWTLVYRGPVATALTAGVYLLGIGIIWFYFDRGSRLLRDWLASEPDAAWGISRLAGSGIRFFGHSMFALAAASVVMILHRERAAILSKRLGEVDSSTSLA